MASTIWTFGVEGSGLYFEIEWDGVSSSVEVTMIEGSMDLNALWWSDGDETSEGSVSLTSKQNSLNMNGAGSIDPDGNAVTWDQVSILSSTGLGKAGTSKSTYLTAGETMTVAIPSGDWASSVADLTIGVRATSVSGLADGSTSLKLVANGDAGEGPTTQRIFVIGEGVVAPQGYFDVDGDGKLGSADFDSPAGFGLEGNVDLANTKVTIEFVGAGPYTDTIDLNGFGEDDSIIVNFSKSWAASTLQSATTMGLPLITLLQRGGSSVYFEGFAGYTYSNYTYRSSTPSAGNRLQGVARIDPLDGTVISQLQIGLAFGTSGGSAILIGQFINFTTEGGGVIPGYNGTNMVGQTKLLARWNLDAATINPNQLSVVWPGNYVPN